MVKAHVVDETPIKKLDEDRSEQRNAHHLYMMAVVIQENIYQNIYFVLHISFVFRENQLIYIKTLDSTVTSAPSLQDTYWTFDHPREMKSI